MEIFNILYYSSYICINIFSLKKGCLVLLNNFFFCHRIYESLNLSIPKWLLLVHVAGQFPLWQLLCSRVLSERGWLRRRALGGLRLWLASGNQSAILGLVKVNFLVDLSSCEDISCLLFKSFR